MKKNKVIVSFALTALVWSLAAGCSSSSDDSESVVMPLISYEHSGQMYCIATSTDRVFIAEIGEGGECGEEFAAAGDMYEPMGMGAGFNVGSAVLDESVIQEAKAWYSAPGPIFFFVSYPSDGQSPELRSADADTEYPFTSMIEGDHVSVAVTMIPKTDPEDAFELRVGDQLTPITISDLWVGGVGGFSEIDGPITIGREIVS